MKENDIFKKKKIDLHLIANCLDVPRRYVKDHINFVGKIPYSILFVDIRRYEFKRKDAMILVRRQVPAEILPWLDHVEKTQEWRALSLCLDSEGNDATDKRLLQSAAKWHEDILCDHGLPDDDDGTVQTDLVLKPKLDPPKK